jgi:hypothetical protein
MKLWLNVHPIHPDVQNQCSNVAGSRSRSPVLVKCLSHVFRVRFITSTPLKGMCRTYVPASRSRSQVEVKCLSHVFRVRSVTCKPLEWVLWNVGEMFTSLIHCAEPVFRLCWLDVKVTSGGRKFERHFQYSIEQQVKQDMLYVKSLQNASVSSPEFLKYKSSWLRAWYKLKVGGGRGCGRATAHELAIYIKVAFVEPRSQLYKCREKR